MSVGWRPGTIAGVWWRALTSLPDDRGAFMEVWRSTWGDASPGPGPLDIRQANLSRSRPGVLRGLHLHRRQADLWVVLDGRAFIALVDLRPAIAGTGVLSVETVDADPGTAVYLPAGVAHGFYAHDGISLLYFVTSEYDGSDELGFAWHDADAGVPWPDPSPIVSARDTSAPSLAQLLGRLRSER